MQPHPRHIDIPDGVSFATFMSRYQYSTQHAKIARNNRALRRLWKLPKDKKKNHLQCSICLDEFTSSLSSKGKMIILACDHAIHEECMKSHTEAYKDRLKQEMFVEVLPTNLFDFCGAPCPLCRCEFPLRHYAAKLYAGNYLSKLPSMEKDNSYV